MTKKLLLAAASVAAIAFAGAASAADITSVTFAGVSQTDNADRYNIADVAAETGDTYSAALTLGVGYDAPLPTANNLLITIQLGGGATFETAVSAEDLIGFDQTTISSGGAAGQNFVTFLVSADPATPVSSFSFGTAAGVGATPVSVEFEAGDEPTVSVRTVTEAGGTPIEGGNATFPNGGTSTGSTSTVTLVDYTPIADIDITAAGSDAVLSLGSDPLFTVFDNGFDSDDTSTDEDAFVLGTISVALNTVYLPAASGALGATPVAASAIENIDVDLNGSDTDLSLELWEGANDELDSADYLTTPFSAQVVALIDGDADSIQSDDYSATVTVNFDDYPSVVASDELASITRAGASAEVPWVASSAVAARNGTNSIIRVANKSNDDAAVYVELLTTAAAQGVPAGALTGPVLAGTVEGGSDLQINTARLTSLLGEFGRGNVLVTIEAAAGSVTVNNRISYADGKVEETTVLP